MRAENNWFEQNLVKHYLMGQHYVNNLKEILLVLKPETFYDIGLCIKQMIIRPNIRNFISRFLLFLPDIKAEFVCMKILNEKKLISILQKFHIK